MTSDPEVSWVTRRLLNDPTITARTNDRVYRGQVADLANPVFPLVTVSRVTPGVADRFAPTSRAPLMLHAWSSTSYDEAMLLYGRAKELLDREQATEAGVSFVIDPLSTPVQYADQEPRAAFAAAGTFRIRRIG